MPNENYIEQALELFHSFAAQDRPGDFVAAAAAATAVVEVAAATTAEAPSGDQGERTVTIPHPYYFVGSNTILNGSLGAERPAGFQSIIFQGDRPVEAPIAGPAGEGIKYLASWTSETAIALNDALQLAEELGRDTQHFAVATVPEVGFTAVWLQDQHELIPIATSKSRSALDPKRIYSEAEIIESLSGQLRERLGFQLNESANEELTAPPKA